MPTPFVPLDFDWTLPDVAGAVAQVQLDVAVGPGLYQWRMKYEFPDTTDARTSFRRLRLE